VSRRLPEEFEGKELAPLCLATKLEEAKEIEGILDRAGIDYTFEIAPVTEQSVFGILFGADKKGVLFLVLTGQLESCANLLQGSGLERLIAV
jgi:hypothetical protein